MRQAGKGGEGTDRQEVGVISMGGGGERHTV
jgi:hypothetical protein